MRLHLSFPVSFFIISITLYQVPICFCDDYKEHCSALFNCGNLRNVGYPFWGSERPEYCGLPGFKLDCNGDYANITIMSENYRVLAVNYSDYSLRVVRTDFWDNVCPTYLDSNPMDFNFFDYRSDSHDLALYYDCPSPPFSQQYIPATQFKCSVNNTDMVSYFLTEVSKIDGSSEKGNCKSSVTVTVLESQAKILEGNPTEENLKAAIDNGFGLVWKAYNKQCYSCRKSDGECGYNTSSSDFTCYCREGPVQSTCASIKNQSSRPPHSNNPMIMNNKFFFFTFVIISSLHPTTSLPSNASLPLCLKTFDCCNIHNIPYPFTGADRPSFCGPPEFLLACRGDFPELSISSVSYRVLQLDPIGRVLTLARLDLWNETCTRHFVNSTFDLTNFRYGPGNEILNLIYGCGSSYEINAKPENLFECEFKGNRSDSYSLIGPLPQDPALNIFHCATRVEVPILQSGATRLLSNRSLLREVLMEGFNVNYSIPYEHDCLKCVDFGGQCGFDYDSREPICICGDHLCPSPEKNSSQNKYIIAGTVAGGAVLLLLLGLWLFLMRRRRKRIAEQSQSKDLFMAPYSRGVATSTTNSSQSVPSYMTSKSESMQHSFFYGVQVFNYAELEEATKNFDPSMELGNGGFGTVYYGTLKDGRTVAVKRLYESNLKRVEQFKNEVGILARLKHKNLVALYGCTSRHSRELLLVYEYIPNGTVSDHLHGNRSKSSLLPWFTRLNIAIETAEALAFLHASDVIHRDVKTNNILLDHKFRVKVADFGLSRLFPNDVTHVSTAPQGTPGYVDPEYYQCYQLTSKSDVYSFGVVLVELISSLETVDITRHRHDINLANLAINRIQNHQVHELIDPLLGFERDNAIKQMTTAVAELAFRCLQQDGDMRPSMDEVLQILKGIQKEGYGGHEDLVVEKSNNRVDEIMLLNKDDPPPFSPDSVADNIWVSSSTTTTTSSSL